MCKDDCSHFPDNSIATKFTNEHAILFISALAQNPLKTSRKVLGCQEHGVVVTCKKFLGSQKLRIVIQAWLLLAMLWLSPGCSSPSGGCFD